MVGEIVTVEVEVTSVEEGFVRYIVLSGPVGLIRRTRMTPSASVSLSSWNLIYGNLGSFGFLLLGHLTREASRFAKNFWPHFIDDYK